MMPGLAPTLLGATTRTYFDVTRLHDMTQWWHWMLLVAVSLGILTFLTAVYRRDAVELPRGTRLLLIALRLVAFLGLLVFFMNIEKRTERKHTTPSRVAMLVDTSQSMGLSDSVTQGSTTPQSRLARLIEELSRGELLNNLREKHDVAVYRFDQRIAPELVASLSKSDTATDQDATPQSVSARLFRQARVLYAVAAAILGFAVIALLAHLIAGRRFAGAEGESWALFASGVSLIVALVVFAVSNLRYSDIPLTAILKNRPVEATPPAVAETSPGEQPQDSAPRDETLDWNQKLVSSGTETRIGDAIRWIVEKERGGPLAGIVVISDGRNNAGLEPELAAELAKEAFVPVYAVGAGSEKMPKSVRVIDLEAPPRVFPGDNFTMTGYVQADGLEGRTVKVQLAVSDPNAEGDNESVRREEQLTLSSDGQIQPVKFELTPEEIGQRRWTFRVVPPRDDLDAADNEKSANVEVVERKNRVLLLAGGPMRDYRFLRNQLFRDKDTTLDVRLQSSMPGAAQEADELLVEFPDSPEAMFEYDCVVAFDPDWRRLTSEQIDVLDRWIAEKAGGLIVVAGPVFTPQWSRSRQDSQSAKLATVKGLYPVTFYERSSASVLLGRYSADTAWPLKFTDDGAEANFLALADTPAESQRAWSDFAGVYGFQAVKDIKRGARVYAYFSDPQTSVDDELPVLMAGQFYGAGRVFYLGTAEMWRLRGVDEAMFERFYTKLIRHVSQGRLLRDSSHGILLVDKERCSLGDSITVRATLSDSQYQPLTVPSVSATILHESGSREPLILRQITNSEREGMYTGQFTTVREGDYRIILPIPDVEDGLLSREVRVRLPAREIERPQRNDALLSEIAKTTDGAYFVSLDAAKGQGGAAPLPNRIAAKDQETFLPGTPDRQFELLLMSWLIAIICGALSLEWLIRRLYKLA